MSFQLTDKALGHSAGTAHRLHTVLPQSVKSEERRVIPLYQPDFHYAIYAQVLVNVVKGNIRFYGLAFVQNRRERSGGR